MGDFSDFQSRQIVGAHLAGASATKTATLLCVSRAAVSKVMTTHTNHGKTSSAKRNSGQKTKTK
jgi:predicted transcriptional regulator